MKCWAGRASSSPATNTRPKARPRHAYLGVRESKLHIGVGYRNDAGEYELVAVETESWVEAAGLSYDELRKD